MKKIKKIPRFRNEKEENEFWLNHDTTEYFDMSRPMKMFFPNLKPSTKKITLRLPTNLLYKIKTLANERDVPYQSFMKVLLNEKVSRLILGA
ncbi:BrnA antitoxin family protein [Patescibacteria group bacterium]|nr:BrnA antitoxin family protein [Patescibacteria group bacterium]MCG2702359.1 BrnA antitoxin family protein [Candidatus Parcubacteria bacterium]MBU4209884.1 BrnA antitoxin family protein [Patescibacteria group bacterium]MBU4264951.1 BrnA antitoxin family protein [Patescibacteria group bacterium]MBU4389788.1 BrnA antitoxin family protein [Patescibacteria group bacterium]